MKARRNSPVKRSPLGGGEIADTDEAFAECDADGDHRIDFGEFSQLLEKLGSALPITQRRPRFDAIDLNHDGVIDRDEFLSWWRVV